jgi:hypothetical protein
LFEDAIKEGIRRGFETVCLELCEDAKLPENRCPKNSDNCICQGIHYSRLPWWKKIFVEGRRPALHTVKTHVIDIKIKDTLKRFGVPHV